VFDRPPCDNLLEEIKVGVSDRGVREVGNSGWSWPTNDADKQNAAENGTTDSVHHEKDSEEPSEENTDPDGWPLEDV
jgi:hypothetical protein